MILIDTTIWSLVLRRRRGNLSQRERQLVHLWQALAGDGIGVLIGPIRQEILSGIRSSADFETIQRQLDGFDHLDVVTGDYDQAARFHNALRSEGIAGTAVDVLICAAAYRHGAPIFTIDRDFARYASHIPLQLYHAAEDA